MTPNRNEMVHSAAQQGKDPSSRKLLLWLGITTVLSVVAALIGGYLLWNEKQRQADAGLALAVQVQKSCKDPDKVVQLGSLCSKAQKVEQTITAGPQGPPGVNGKNGVDGVDGVNGQDGAPGVNGKNGRNGTNGVDGKDGAPGPAGPAGPAGKDGTDGTNGTDGKDAFPMSWTFQFSPNPAQQYSFICVLQDPATQVNCTPQ